jgi:hypothetical protein
LALMKSPTVFAKQANISAGPQQVNNGIVNNGFARAEVQKSAPNELLEEHGERMDGGAKGEPESRDTPLETVGVFDRSSDSARKGPLVTQRLQRG